jgi:4-cresol dehydrogenase (hydroxylating)
MSHYVFTPLALFHWASAALSFWVAAFVVSKKRTRATALFGFFQLAIGLWQIANALILSSVDPATAHFWSRAAYLGVVFIPIGIYHYCALLGRFPPSWPGVGLLYGAGAGFLALTYGGDAFLSGVNRYPWGHWFRAGPLHPLFIVFLFGLLVAGTGQLLSRSRFLEDENDQRLARRVFWAFVIGSLGAVDLLADYGINVRPLGCLPVSFAVLMLTHLVLFEGLMGVPTIDPAAHHRLLDFFSSLAPFQEQTAEIARDAHPAPDQRVLDVACGTGALREALDPRVAYVGFDGNEPALAAARVKFPLESAGWVHGDPGRAWPFPDRSFDRVFLVNPLAFVGMGNPAFLLTEAARVLKTDGEILVLGRTKGSLIRRLFAADLESAWARGGAAAAAREFRRVGPRLFRLAYELMVLTRERPPQALVDMNVNELLAALRQNGFTPGRVRKTRHSPHVLVTARPATPRAAIPPPAPLPEAAARALTAAVGEAHFLTDAERLAPYHRNTLPTDRRVRAAARPADVEEVRALLRVAGEHGLSVYPVSGGHNWGYGSAQPVRDDSVVMDLGRMNRILEVNAELGYAVIEPGVTQGQLAEYLEKNHIPFCVDGTGAGPRASLVGNALERGFGLGQYGDHFAAVAGFEVVLPDGQLLKTGFGHFDGAKGRWVYKWGVGPYLDGLFTQSNFGVVVKMGLWLAPAPERIEMAYFACRDENAIVPLVDAFRPLVMRGFVQGSLVIAHRDRALLMARQYPWEETGGRTPMPAEVARAVAAQGKIFTWSGIAPLYGTQAQINASKKALRAALKGKVDELRFISRGTIRFLDQFKKILSVILNMDIPGAVQTLRFTFGLAAGRPGEHSLRMSWWRNTRHATPARDLDPDRDRCGLMWLVPIVPLTGRHVQEFLDVVRPICAKHGFEAPAMFTTVNARALDSTFPVFFDKDNPDECERATACYNELLAECLRAGFIPYRNGVRTMGVLTGRDDPYWNTVERLKGFFDPKQILSPGRYSR